MLHLETVAISTLELLKELQELGSLIETRLGVPLFPFNTDTVYRLTLIYLPIILTQTL